PIEAVDPTWVSIPYGWPMTNAKYHLLTEAMEPCPTWVPGQIHMSGIGVARGFWRDEERTRAKFVIHPSTGERLYRAGDLGRYWPDGTIEFLGREDLQVKVQGYRIELGEIEAALAQHPSVRTAVATVAQAAGGKRRLVAFIVAEAADRAALADELLEFATAKLPRHMIPAMVVRDSLPITANGKVDRKALGALAAEALQPRVAYVAPNSELEQTIAKYVQEVLQLSEVSVDVQLFDLGATSMHIVRLTSMLREALKVDVRVTDPFLYPTVRALAAFLGQSAQQQPAAKTGVSRAEARLAARGRKAL
ncbi:non-ribosomal peptide synthetase, partial [Hyalangium sp.]|uniref:non-ribosomal peptide synthetase n=1 Tax=Hyalangium sp. TaxID=2028555 RepID=UPI002D3C03E4